MPAIDLEYSFEELPLIADKSGLLGLLADGTATIEIADTRDRESWSINRIFVIGHLWRPGARLETGRIEIERDERPGSWWLCLHDALMIRRFEEIQAEVDEALDDSDAATERPRNELHAEPL